MVAARNGRINFLKDKTGAKRSSVGLVSFIRGLTRFFRRAEKMANELSIKKDVVHLEKERAKEHAELLRQRKFYEHLLYKKRLADSQAEITPKIKQEIIKKPVAKIIKEDKPVIKESIIDELTKKPTREINSELQQFAIKPKIESIKTEPREIELKKLEIERKTKPGVDSLSKIVKAKHNWFFKKANQVVKHSSLVKKLAEERKAEEAVRHKKEVEERSWQPYNSVKANLIKDQGLIFFNWRQKILTLFLALLLCCLAISLFYVGLLIWQKERLNDNKATLANYEAINIEIAKNEKEIKEIIEFNKNLEIVSFILNNHVYWSNFLSFLENSTLKNIYYENFSGDLSGKYSIPTVAKNLETISLQLEVMKAYNMIRTIQYSSAQAVPATTNNPGITKFKLDVSVDPKIFMK